MKKIAEFSVNHSLFVNLLSVLILIIGGVSMFLLKREAFPEISFDTVIVQTVFRNAAAADVERLVTAPIERMLREVDDIEEMVSSSREGISSIALTISPDARDTDKIVNDIQKAVDRVTALPADVEDRPVVTELTSRRMPVIKIAVSGSADEAGLRQAVDNLKDKLEDIPGVAAVERRGWREQEYWVEPDVNKMRAAHVSLTELMAALAGRNVTLSAGKLQMPRQEIAVKTVGEFSSIADIADTVIRGNDAGRVLRVSDVAAVRDTFEDQTERSKTLGRQALSLTVQKKEQGDAITIVDAVKQLVASVQPDLPPGIELRLYDDFSYYIRRRLGVLVSNGIIGFALVCILLVMFLHARLAFFTALGIPMAMCATFWVMYVSGISVNLMTMFGLIVVLGMVVDDGIIIAENVYRYVEAGMDPRQAAIQGTAEVIAPVTATVVTTVAAFAPLLFMTGIIGKFMRFIPLMVIIALAASIVEAFFILPSHLADFLKPVTPTPRKDADPAGWFARFSLAYRGLLAAALQRRYWVAVFITALFIGSLALARYGMQFILFPARGIEEFQIYAEAPVGTTLEYMDELLAPVEAAVNRLPPDYVDMYETFIGALSQVRSKGDPSAKYGPHCATLTVYLTPLQQRDKDSKAIIALLRPDLAKIDGFERLYINERQPGPPVGKAIDVRVRGEDFATLRAIAGEIKDFLAGVAGISDIRDSYDSGGSEIELRIDEEQAARAGLTVAAVADTVRAAIAGGVATTVKQVSAEAEIKVRVRLPPEQRADPALFDRLLIANRAGNLVPLSTIVRQRQQQELRTIGHLDGKRFLSVTADVDQRQITAMEANRLLTREFNTVSARYPGYTLRFKGEQEETQKSLRNLAVSFGVAFLLIFMILAVQFNSLVQPLVVMLTIPFALIGVILTFYAHQEPISFLALLGIVGLAGIVVNDSIVLVDFINKQRQQGVSRRESILRAGTLRLRPVLLTTLTTVAGLSTVAYGIGGFDPFLKPMALAIGWGLLCATALTLVVMPCYYAIIDDITVRVACHPTVRRLRKNGDDTCERLKASYTNTLTDA